MLLFFPFFFFFAWLCFCSDSFINQLPKELLKLHAAVAFTVMSLLLISVNQSSRQTRTESIFPFDIFDAITPPNYEKCARRKRYRQPKERTEIELWCVIKELGLSLEKINISSPKMQL